MRVLYVSTAMPIPIRDIVAGKNEITGWPAYYYPMKRLIDQGNEVDFIFCSEIKEYKISVRWFKKEQIVANIYSDREAIPKMRHLHRKIYLLGIYLKYCYEINKHLRNKKYDFVYCQSGDVAGNILANLYNIPCGMRLYGDVFRDGTKFYQTHEYIENYSRAKLFVSNPNVYLQYKLKKKFLLVTDDGSKADITFKLLAPRQNKYKFFFWKSGVDKSPVIDDLEEEIVSSYNPYIVYPARVDNIKRQDRAINVLRILHDKGRRIHLYLIGQTHNGSFYEELVGMIHEYKLDGYVHFLGGIPQNKMKFYAKNAIANILVSDVSNRGNVFYELMCVGTPVISVDDGSLNEYIDNKINGFLAKDEKQIAEYVETLLDDDALRKSISEKALETSKRKILSEDKRFQMEVELIIKSAGNISLDDIPVVL